MTIIAQPETGQRILERRVRLGLSTRDFSVPSSTLSRYERGERVPKMEALVEIAKTLKTTANELTGDGRCPFCGRD